MESLAASSTDFASIPFASSWAGMALASSEKAVWAEIGKLCFNTAVFQNGVWDRDFVKFVAVHSLRSAGQSKHRCAEAEVDGEDKEVQCTYDAGFLQSSHKVAAETMENVSSGADLWCLCLWCWRHCGGTRSQQKPSGSSAQPLESDHLMISVRVRQGCMKSMFRFPLVRFRHGIHRCVCFGFFRGPSAPTLQSHSCISIIRDVPEYLVSAPPLALNIAPALTGSHPCFFNAPFPQNILIAMLSLFCGALPLLFFQLSAALLGKCELQNKRNTNQTNFPVLSGRLRSFIASCFSTRLSNRTFPSRC